MRRLVPVVALLAAGVTTGRAEAFDPGRTFRQGTIVVSGEGGYAEQSNVGDRRLQTGLEFWNAGLRLSILPLAPMLPGPLRGSLEVGLEPLYQRYVDPRDGSFVGLGGAFRYHFLALGRVVPYLEVLGAAGRTDLETREIRSDFTFLVHGGGGLSVLVTDRTAVYAGYRFQHVSNGNTKKPNRGFESHGGVVGLSLFFQ